MRSTNLVGVNPHWDTEGSGQTKVCYLDAAILVDEKVLWLHVSVENSPLMAEQDPLEQLVEVALGQLRVHLAVLGDVGVHVLLEVHRQKLEYQIQLGLLHQNILIKVAISLILTSPDRYLESHNVGVLQLLQQGDLSDGRAWHSLVLRLKPDLLHGNNLSGLGVSPLKDM